MSLSSTQLTLKLTTGPSAELSYKQSICITPSPIILRAHLGTGGRKSVRAICQGRPESSGHDRTETLMNLQAVVVACPRPA